MGRYSRQILVYGKESQKKISKAKIAIVGLGGTGTHIAETLARAGVGHLLLIDRDVIDESNLQRQALYEEDDVGTPKAITAKRKLDEINSNIKIDELVEDINPTTVNTLLRYDIIVDATDNMSTRMLLNDFSKKYEKHFVYSGAIREQGMVAFFSPEGPCLSCIIPRPPMGGDTCDIVGITGPAVGIVGQIAAHEVLNYLAGRFRDSRLISISLKDMKFSTSLIERRPNCKACEGEYPYLDGRREEIEEICGSGYQFNPQKNYNLNMKHLKGHLEMHKEYQIKSFSKDTIVVLYKGKEATIFKTGRIIIKNVSSAKEAKSIAAKIISI